MPLAGSAWRSFGQVLAPLLLALASSACSGDDGPDDGPDPQSVSVEIGVPAGDDDLGFAPLLDGDELRLHTFGQGGTHVLLAIRCVGFGSRAFVSVTLKNRLTGAEAASPAPVRPQLLLCRDESVCDLVPLLTMASGLTLPGAERHGLPIDVLAEVHNQAGEQASASRTAVLSTADL